jgi:lysine-N-methylase
MSLKYKTPGYFKGFQCLGGECPDTCCQQWDIKLDREHYDKLSDLMNTDTNQKKLFEQFIKIKEQPVTGDHDFAYIKMNEQGQCPMLETSGLCSLHREYGVEPLGNICAFFPRVISRCEQDIEMSGAMSCPEVVRLCLQETAPVKLSHFNLSDLPRQKNYPIHRELPHIGIDYYAQHFKRIRLTLQNILNETSFGIDTRLYALATFANRISEIYHKGCINPQPMLDVIIDKTIPNIVRLDEFVQNYESHEPVALIVIHSILQIKQQRFQTENISHIAELVYQRYVDELTPENDNDDVDASALQDEFYKHARLFEQAFPGKLDQYLSRYIENCIFREWFYTMPDVFTYIQMLLIRTAILRFLIISHPEIISTVRRQIDQSNTENEHALFEKVTYVVYNFARSIDQNTAFLQVIFNAVSEQDMMNYDYSLAFIKI